MRFMLYCLCCGASKPYNRSRVNSACHGFACCSWFEIHRVSLKPVRGPDNGGQQRNSFPGSLRICENESLCQGRWEWKFEGWGGFLSPCTACLRLPPPVGRSCRFSRNLTRPRWPTRCRGSRRSSMVLRHGRSFARGRGRELIGSRGSQSGLNWLVSSRLVRLVLPCRIFSRTTRCGRSSAWGTSLSRPFCRSLVCGGLLVIAPEWMSREGL